MAQDNNLTPRNYVVSPLTAEWLDIIVASQSLYSKAFHAASELYGESGTMQDGLLEAFNNLQDKLLELMGASVVDKLGTISNLQAARTEI